MRGAARAAHMRPMTASIRPLSALVLTALIALSATGCSAPKPSAPIGGEDRVGSVESPEPSAPSLPVGDKIAAARLQLASSRTDDSAPSLVVPDKSVGAAAHAKVCEYTAAAVNAAASRGYGIPSVARSTAEKILASC